MNEDPLSVVSLFLECCPNRRSPVTDLFSKPGYEIVFNQNLSKKYIRIEIDVFQYNGPRVGSVKTPDIRIFIDVVYCIFKDVVKNLKFVG